LVSFSDDTVTEPLRRYNPATSRYSPQSAARFIFGEQLGR
jgi:hypothetical protein